MFGIIIFGLILFIVAVGATYVHDEMKKSVVRQREAMEQRKQDLQRLAKARPQPKSGSIDDLLRDLGMTEEPQQPKEVTIDDIKEMINKVQRAKIVRKPGVSRIPRPPRR